jgi:hypothetical protein
MSASWKVALMDVVVMLREGIGRDHLGRGRGSGDVDSAAVSEGGGAAASGRGC